jgi:hypothetical protein
MVYIETLNIDEVRKGKEFFAEKIKILFYKKNAELIKLLDINDDEIFLDPLIYAYFNDPDAESKTTLEQLAYGYIVEEKKPKKIRIITDENCIAYLPKIGYFFVTSAFKKVCFLKTNIRDGFIVSDEADNKLSFEYYQPLFADENNQIELSLFQHPLIKQYFRVNRPSYPNQNAPCEVEVNRITLHLKEAVFNAFHFIKSNFPHIYKTIIAANKRIMVFYNPAVLCFAHQNLLGMSFFSALSENSMVFFIEEILHQCSHNIFNVMFYDKSLYFKLDFEREMLGEHLNNPHETRTLFNVFHGLVTVSQRLVCYQHIIQNSLLSGHELHELTGRYCDQYKRLNSGLEKLNIDNLYTEQGKRLYREMRQLSENALTYFKNRSEKFDLTNQPSEFNYEKFLQLNPL